MSATRRSVFVTGASDGGIGSAFAQEFQRCGFQVFAGVRDKSKASELSSLENVDVIQIDVQSSESIKNAKDEIADRLGGEGLDVLVNNAGAGYTMPLVDTDLDAARKVFEVNFWGLLATVQAFTPLLIQAKGTIVNVSSVGGVVNVPWIGIYAASKAAVTCMSETLRLELAPFDVKVMTVQTGVVATHFLDNNPIPPLPNGSLYAPAEETIRGPAKGKPQPKSMPPDVLAQQVVRDVLRGTTGKVWHGSNAGSVKLSIGYLPTSVLDKLMVAGRGLEKLNLKADGNV